MSRGLTLHELLKTFEEQDFKVVKTMAVQYLINSGRMDEDASAAAWCIAVVDRLKYKQDLIREAKATKEDE